MIYLWIGMALALVAVLAVLLPVNRHAWEIRELRGKLGKGAFSRSGGSNPLFAGPWKWTAAPDAYRPHSITVLRAGETVALFARGYVIGLRPEARPVRTKLLARRAFAAGVLLYNENKPNEQTYKERNVTG